GQPDRRPPGAARQRAGAAPRGRRGRRGADDRPVPALAPRRLSLAQRRQGSGHSSLRLGAFARDSSYFFSRRKTCTPNLLPASVVNAAGRSVLPGGAMATVSVSPSSL